MLRKDTTREGSAKCPATFRHTELISNKRTNDPNRKSRDDCSRRPPATQPHLSSNRDSLTDRCDGAVRRAGLERYDSPFASHSLLLDIRAAGFSRGVSGLRYPRGGGKLYGWYGI